MKRLIPFLDSAWGRLTSESGYCIVKLESRKWGAPMFFFDESLETFEMFSLSHLFADLFWITAITLMIVFRKKLRELPKFDRILRPIAGELIAAAADA